MNKRLPCSQGLGTGLRGWPDSNAASPSRLGEARRTSTGGLAELQAHTIERSEALDTIAKRHRTSFRSLPCRGRLRAVSAARMKPGRTPGRYPSGLRRARFPGTCARARRERYHFDDVCVSAPQTLRLLRLRSLSPNSIRRRQQRASAPQLPPPCAEQPAIAAPSLADPD